MNETFTATVDRVVDQQTAVILVKDDEVVVEQLDVPVEELPEPVQREGSVLSIKLKDKEIVSVQYGPDDTHERQEAAQKRT